MTNPKLKMGDTVVLYRRWFLWVEEYVLCEVMGGRYDTYEKEWRYTLRIGNQLRRFCKWEHELDQTI